MDAIDQKIDWANLPVVEGAAFDSYMDQHEDECLPGTRTDICRQITKWAVSPTGKCIFWLNGMAGTGKSTISRTIAKSLKQSNFLGASFFFKRGEGDRGNAKKFFPTISRQLATKIPSVIPGVRKAIYDDHEIMTKSLKEQFEKLLLRPLQGIAQSDYTATTMVIVIDALDECERDDDIRVILQLLQRVRICQSVRLRFLLTSRPELSIRLGFRDITDRQDLILHEIPQSAIKHDITLFVEHKLERTRRNRSLPPDWPGTTNIQSLVLMSIPLFIFAATMCRLLEDPQWDPMESLTEILTHRSDESNLDRTYLPVLDRLLEKQNETKRSRLVQDFRDIVGTIVLLENPLPVTNLSRLLGISEKFIKIRLVSLHSVLRVTDDETLPVRLLHLSFREFLLDPKTRVKTPFWVDGKQIHHKLTRNCLRLMDSRLKKNICNLGVDGIERVEISAYSIDQYLPPEVQYSCRYWAQHLAQSEDPVTELGVVFTFLKKHFLHWVEAMSLLGIISEVVETIGTLHSIIQVSRSQAS